MKLTIERSRWLRGEGSEKSYLLRPDDNKMCCLGFLCSALGVPEDMLHGCGSPDAIGSELEVALPRWLGEHPGEVGQETLTDVGRAIDANDATAISDSEREKQIKAIFRKHKVYVTFVD